MCRSSSTTRMRFFSMSSLAKAFDCQESPVVGRGFAVGVGAHKIENRRAIILRAAVPHLADFPRKAVDAEHLAIVFGFIKAIGEEHEDVAGADVMALRSVVER